MFKYKRFFFISICHKRSYKRGQVVVEYALLLLVSVAMFFAISQPLVSREKGDEGFIIKKWQNILQVIGDDCPSPIRGCGF